MKPDPTQRPPSDWTIEHPWLHIYTVITTMLLGFIALSFLLDALKGALP